MIIEHAGVVKEDIKIFETIKNFRIKKIQTFKNAMILREAFSE